MYQDMPDTRRFRRGPWGPRGRPLPTYLVPGAGHGCSMSSVPWSSKTSSAGKTETINGMTVPSEPDVKLNATTLAGVDSDKNGIRDDIDRILATDFGSSHPKIEALVAFAKAEQAMLLAGTQASVKTTDYIYVCSGLTAKETDVLTYKLLNTAERNRTYKTLMSNAPIMDIRADQRACKT